MGDITVMAHTGYPIHEIPRGVFPKGSGRDVGPLPSTHLSFISSVGQGEPGASG